MNRSGWFSLLCFLPLTLAVPGAVLAQQFAAAPGSVSALSTPTRTPTPKQKTDRPAPGTGPGFASQASGAKSALPTATPTPLPVPKKPPSGAPAASSSAGAGSSMTAILNTPQHSPDQLQFSDVWDGQSSMKAFSLTTLAAGFVKVEIPPGPFRVVEIRELGPPKTASSKNPGGGFGQQPMISQETKGKVLFLESQPAPWTYYAVAGGDQVLIQVVFRPKFNIGTMMAGPKSATMKVSGPGPRGNWTLSVPLNGMFNGLKIAGTLLIEEKEPMIVEGTQSFEVPVSIAAAASPLKGTIRGGGLPKGVSVTPLQVSVAAGAEQKAKVGLLFQWGGGGLPTNGQPQPAELLLEHPGGTLKAAFGLVGVPRSVSSGFSNRQDCGIQALGALAIFEPSGRLVFSLSGQNQDFINNRDVRAFVSIAGRPVAWGKLHIPFDASGQTKSDYKQWDNRRVHVNFDSRYRAEDYTAAVRGPIVWTCGLGETLKAPF